MFFALIAFFLTPSGSPDGHHIADPAARPPETAAATDRLTHQPDLSGPIHISVEADGEKYQGALIAAFRKKGLQVVDDPARSAITVSGVVDVAVSPGLSVNTTATWQATSDATLQAVATDGGKPIFKSVQQGHATALQSDHAAAEAVADALDKAVDDYVAVAKRKGD